MRQQYGGPKLPKTLRDQIGDPANKGKPARGRNAPLNRKDRRKQEREEQKVQKRQPHVRQLVGNRRPKPESESEAEGFDDDDDFSEPEPAPVSASKKLPQKPLRSILKKAQPEEAPESRREPSPSPPPHISKAVKDKLAEEDAEIAALEKKLGIKGKKKSKSEFDDGLDDLFGDLDGLDSGDEDIPGAPPSKRKRIEDDEWLASKRRKALSNAPVASESEGSEDGFDEGFDDESEDGEEMEDFGSEEEESDGDEELDGEGFDDEFGSEGDLEDEEEAPQPRVRENPYVAPVAADAPQPAKYIPPALRGPPSSDSEALARLKRQVQGLLNRLSDANIVTILRDIEQVYQNNARGYVTTTLVDLLVGLLADETTLLDTFLILHSGFIAAIYKVIGPDFGAQMVERLVSEFDKWYPINKAGSGKQTTNIISVFAELYTFQVIGSNLVFDYIKLFLEELSEINTELLLRVVRAAGSQLRQDDPSSLKDIVILLHNSVSKVGESNLPVRTKFMIETIRNLKDNRMKAGVAASAVTTEHRTRMKKNLGSLNTRNLKGTEPIRVGLQDLKSSDKKGKWWLVGASWRNNMADGPSASRDDTNSIKTPETHHNDEEEGGEVDLLTLARENRMNTDVRRAIFITIMGAADFKDAHQRLLKLNLKRAQEMEIPRIIVHCAGQEKNYNPYYTLLARKLCSDHKTRKGFQFALWDVFKNLGEKKDEDEGSDDEDQSSDTDMSLRKLVNLGKLYGSLIASEGLSITSLKPLSFQYLKAKTKTFVQILLVTVILESQKKAKDGRDQQKLLNIFVNADAAPGMIAGLQYFLKKVLRKTELVASKEEKETVQWACKIVGDMLTRLMATVTLDED